MVGEPAQRAGRAARPARRLRGPARQRRDHGVLGRRHLRADRPAQPAPVASASSRRSSPRPSPPRRTSATPRSSSRDPGTHPDAVADRRHRRLLPSPTTRPRPAWPCRSPAPRAPTDDALVLVDATSAAGGLRFDPRRSTSTTSPPRSAWPPTAGCGSPPCSPAAIERIERIAAVGPLDPGVARPRASPSTTRRKDQTYNTPALATIFLADAAGRLDQRQRRPRVRRRPLRPRRPRSSTAGPRPATSPRRSSPTPPKRSHVVGHHRPRRRDRRQHRRRRSCGPTASSTPSSYRKLGRNQLRIAMFPAIDPADVDALTRCIDHVVAALG